MDGPRFSFYPFLKEPMVELEPGVVEDHDSLASFNNELEQSIGQILGTAYANTQQANGSAATDKNELKNCNVRPAKRAAMRTKISLYQKLQLEYAFQYNPYPSQAARAQLAYSIGLGNQTLLNWFKKRRYRGRREHLNSGELVASPYFLPVSHDQVQVLGQHSTPQEICPCWFQEPLAGNQESQQLPF